jgi:hypothetical protein
MAALTLLRVIFMPFRQRWANERHTYSRRRIQASVAQPQIGGR